MVSPGLGAKPPVPINRPAGLTAVPSAHRPTGLLQPSPGPCDPQGLPFICQHFRVPTALTARQVRGRGLPKSWSAKNYREGKKGTLHTQMHVYIYTYTHTDMCKHLLSRAQTQARKCTSSKIMLVFLLESAPFNQPRFCRVSTFSGLVQADLGSAIQKVIAGLRTKYRRVLSYFITG